MHGFLVAVWMILLLRFAHTGCQHSNTLVTARLQQWRSSSTTNRAANRRPCIFRGCSCVESATHRTQTDAVINNNFCWKSVAEDVFIFYCVLNMECTIGLTVGGTLEMLLLLFWADASRCLLLVVHSRSRPSSSVQITPQSVWSVRMVW